VAALLAAVAVPGSALFAAHITIAVGALPLRPLATALSLFALALLAAAHGSFILRAFFGTFPHSWRQSLLLEAHGGRLPRVSVEERWLLGPLAAASVLLGLWTGPVTALVSNTALDLAESVTPPGPAQIARRSRGRLRGSCPITPT
jgi:NADH:ubiquinone oxidoreductase subunit 4 (subunit M)